MPAMLRLVVKSEPVMAHKQMNQAIATRQQQGTPVNSSKFRAKFVRNSSERQTFNYSESAISLLTTSSRPSVGVAYRTEHLGYRSILYREDCQLEPSEFCRKWVTSLKPDNWGYRQACIQVLTEATGLSESTINSWGKNFERRPDHILHILDKDDIIRRFEEKTVPKISDRTLTDIGPWEYCVYWIDTKQPNERGFRVECVRELEKATLGYYKFTTINHRWGSKFEKCPKLALSLIKYNHYLKIMQQMLSVMTIPENQADCQIYEKILIYVNILLSEAQLNK